MNKILITGVAGFIGSNLANYLLQNEDNVVFGIDNFSSSTMSNLYSLLKNPRFTFIEQDVKNNIDLCVEQVYHFAGCGDLSQYYNDKHGFILNNIKIIENITNFCRDNGARLVLPTLHQDNHAINSDLFQYYSYLKLIEDITLDLVQNNKLNAVFVKLEDIYGEGINKNDTRFLHKIFLDILNNENLTLEHDTSHYYTYIQDVCANLEIVMNNYIDKNIVDLINPNLYLKSDLIKLIINYSKSSSKLDLKSEISFSPSYTPSECMTQNGTKLAYQTKILDGITKTVEYYKLFYFS